MSGPWALTPMHATAAVGGGGARRAMLRQSAGVATHTLLVDVQERQRRTMLVNNQARFVDIVTIRVLLREAEDIATQGRAAMSTFPRAGPQVSV